MSCTVSLVQLDLSQLDYPCACRLWLIGHRQRRLCQPTHPGSSSRQTLTLQKPHSQSSSRRQIWRLGSKMHRQSCPQMLQQTQGGRLRSRSVPRQSGWMQQQPSPPLQPTAHALARKTRAPSRLRAT